MGNLKKIYILLLAAVSINMFAWNVAPLLQDDPTRNRNRQQNQTPDDKDKNNIDTYPFVILAPSYEKEELLKVVDSSAR